MKKSSTSGFTLSEILMILFVIGILTSLAGIAFIKSMNRSRATTLVNDLRIYEQAFNNYFMETNLYPGNESINQEFPVGLEGYWNNSWNEPSPIGGMYLYRIRNRNNVERRQVRIQIRQIAGEKWRMKATREVLQAVDDMIDDGDLTDGRFRRISNNRIHYYLSNEPN